jgi:cellulose synthase/poly-beta-1,6-N-acetylglucosamine synthase-like glycosyltransferase
MTELLFCLAGFFLLCFLHPFATYPLSLLLIRCWRSGGRTDSVATVAMSDSFAVCFCAFNEEKIIGSKIRNLLALHQVLPQLEILAYVDGATDHTTELLRLHADRIKLIVSRERRGKTHGMNLLVQSTAASIIVFTDANTLLDLDAVINLRPYFADPRVGCVCGQLIYTNAADSPMAGASGHYRRLEEWVRQLETDTGSMVGGDGSIFAIRRHLYPKVPEDLIDDFYVSLSILCDGYRIVHAPDVKAYERASVEASDELHRRLRISCQAFNVHRALWRRLLRLEGLSLYKYISHKLMRWLSGYSLVLAAVFCTTACAYDGISLLGPAVAMLVPISLFLGSRWRLGLVSQLHPALCALGAISLGLWLSLWGEKFRIWTPTRR